MKKTTLVFGLVLFGGIISSPAIGETVVGRWCDKMVPNAPDFNGTMSLVITDDGTPEMRTKFNDGSNRTVPLSEEGNEVYKEIGSRFGDGFRIVPSTGNLQLLDNDGLIRTAKRLENTPRKGEC